MIQKKNLTTVAHSTEPFLDAAADLALVALFSHSFFDTDSERMVLVPFSH